MLGNFNTVKLIFCNRRLIPVVKYAIYLARMLYVPFYLSADSSGTIKWNFAPLFSIMPCWSKKWDHHPDTIHFGAAIFSNIVISLGTNLYSWRNLEAIYKKHPPALISVEKNSTEWPKLGAVFYQYCAFNLPAGVLEQLHFIGCILKIKKTFHYLGMHKPSPKRPNKPNSYNINSITPKMPT